MSGAMQACWRAEDAKAIFVTEALEGDDAIFLATHTPVDGFDVAGRDAGEIKSMDEGAVLDALANENRTHAFCVVQGEPGSGKSHLIRWLSINWPYKDDVKLLLRRADGSLEGALSQLKSRLPEEFAPLFDNLGQRQKASPQGRANIFLSTLANTLEVGHYDPPLDDEAWCRDFGPAEILSHVRVRTKWASPGRILGLLEGAKGERNSASATFDLFDLQALAESLPAIYGSGVSGKAEELARRLLREEEVITAYRNEGWLADEIETDPDAQPRLRTSLAFLKALNRRKNDAIQNVLGVSAEGLKTLFRNVRQALAQRGQRLVLLLEDITSWEGLDDSLIDVLVFNADARGDGDHAEVCPLISVVGVTPAYYEKLQANYKQRITHEIRLGDANGGLQDVATLRDRQGRQRFLARYLSAVRAGETALGLWRSTFSAEEPTEPPNPCQTCSNRTRCFATFGEDEGRGLFPFSPRAFDRMFEALKDNDAGQTWRTPRGLLQAVLNPSLSQPEAIAAGRFPPRVIEPTAFRDELKSDRALSRRLDQMVAAGIEDAEEQARMRRLLAYWADPERAGTTLVDGELAFAAAPKSLFEAFQAPWLGGEAAGEDGASEVRPVEPVASLALEDIQGEAPPAPVTRYGVTRPARPPVTAPKPKRATVKTSDFELLRASIRDWHAGTPIQTASRWNQHLHAIISRLDARRMQMAPVLFSRLVTLERVKLEGTTGGGRDYLTVPREAWAINGLEAYLALGWDKSLPASDADFHRRNLATFLRRLEDLTIAYVSRRVPRDSAGRLWRPAATFAQVLLARAWLRGAVSPSAPIADQLRTLLSDEVEATSDPRARSQPWQDWLNQTDKLHARLRDELRLLVSLTVDDSVAIHGLTDVSEVAGAVHRLIVSGLTDEAPQGDANLPDEYMRALELASTWRDKAAHIDRTEFSQLKNRSANLLTSLRNSAIDQHLQRLSKAITAVAASLPAVAPDKVTFWKKYYESLESQGRLAPEILQPMEDWLVDMELPDSGTPETLALRLGWLASRPARALDDLGSLAAEGERLIDILLEHTAACVREASGAATLSMVQDLGRSLIETARRPEASR